jgi:hypothetical protein
MFRTDVKGAARARAARYIMLELEEHRLRLPQNLPNQSFTPAHTGEIIQVSHMKGTQAVDLERSWRAVKERRTALLWLVRSQPPLLHLTAR